MILFTGGQEQQSMKEILATLARTSEGSDQLPSYEGLSMSLPKTILIFNSGSFLRRQLWINNYHVKKYVKESQFLFSRQKVYKNAKFVYITEIL